MNKIRARPFKKATSYLKYGLIVLLVISIIALIGTAFNGRSNTTPSNSGSNLKDLHIPFCGNIIKYWDFEGLTDTDYSPGVSYTGDNIKIAPKLSTLSFADGKYSLISDASSYSGSRVDAFAIFGYGTKMYLENFSYYMIDADISTSLSYPYEIRITPDFRSSDYSNMSDGQKAELVYYNRQLSDRNGNVLAEIEDDSFHLTYIFDSTGVAYVYLDGSYVGTFTSIYKTGARYCDGFKITSYTDSSPTEECFLSVDNVALTTFAPEYMGAITSLSDDPDVSLSKNSDTLAYQERFGYTPQILYTKSFKDE